MSGAADATNITDVTDVIDTTDTVASDLRERVIPEPKNIDVLGEGQLDLPFQGTVVLGKGVGESRVIHQLLDDIEFVTAARWDLTRWDLQKWDLEGSPVPSADAQIGCISLAVSDFSGAQGEYRLRVEGTPGTNCAAVSIVGQDEEGVRNGVQTLRQLLRTGGGALPRVEIHDWPDFAARGYYLDVTRGRVPRLEWLKQWADKLSLYKYNQLHLYVEHSFKFRGLSQMWSGRDPLTAEELTDFERYCASLGIDFVPSIATFGHLYEMLRTSKFRDLSEFPLQAERPFSFVERMNHHTLNPVEPRSIELSAALIDEYASLFTSRYFNIGGDETFDLGRGASKQQASEVGVNQLYVDYVDKLCKKIVADHKIPLMWADILLNDPSLASQLPDDTIFLNWEYGENVSEEKNRQIENTGHRYYVCPGVSSWNRLVPNIHAAWVNISQMARYGALHHAEGMLTTDWGDFGHVNDPRLSAPAMVMAAEYSWNPTTEISYETLLGRVSKVEYRDPSPVVLAAMTDADLCAFFDWSSIVTYKEMGNSAGVNKEVFARQFGKQPSEHDTDADCVRAILLKSLPLESERIQESERRLRAGRREVTLAASERGVWTSMRAPLLMAIRGIEIWNQVGGFLRNPTPCDPATGALIADRLEMWWAEYARVWSDVSRHSELERLHEIVEWYSLRLRKAGKA